MQDTVSQAKASFLQAKALVLKGLENTPEDRLSWSPSPSARSIVQQVIHAAVAVKDIQTQLAGQPFRFEEIADADKAFREFESQFTTREQALNLLEQNCAEYVSWLEDLTPEGFAADMTAPFRLGSVPVSIAISFPADHLRWHAAQIDYIQTIYGDRDWHIG